MEGLIEVAIELVAGLLECVIDFASYRVSSKEHRKTRKAVKLKKKKKRWWNK